ncbi:tetratricopeptide repeat protein [Sphingobacterium sp. BIGb0165]|uniref:tetratricopeptide repeat protein n=1 Tax=Sphingobacterium sp. BIGb0165 TaxID=2940615 RepID=UPI00216A470B|nr:tetratricopeptide repeat protein [Sphingobacterium sp. BIGb0165]MCS4227436.1 tetratricopeptide (TPR) repeat protein [Sphingobacterium sp. BIGb0165]
MANSDLRAIERYWQTLTLSSNLLYNADKFEEALLSYQCALASAELLNNHLTDCIYLEVPVMQVYIISCNNLANTYIALGDFEQAERMLKRVLYYLLHLVVHVQLDQNEIQTELKRATSAYQQFAEETNMEKHKRALFFDLFKEQLFERE